LNIWHGDRRVEGSEPMLQSVNSKWTCASVFLTSGMARMFGVAGTGVGWLAGGGNDILRISSARLCDKKISLRNIESH